MRISRERLYKIRLGEVRKLYQETNNMAEERAFAYALKKREENPEVHDKAFAEINLLEARFVEHQKTKNIRDNSVTQIEKLHHDKLEDLAAQNKCIQNDHLISGTIYGLDLRYFQFQRSSLEKARFEHCKLEEADFRDSTFFRTQFTGSSVKSCRFTGCTFDRCSFGGNLSSSDFRNCVFIDCYFPESSNLKDCDFANSKFENSKFSKLADISQASFSQCQFDEAAQLQFDENNISGATFRGRRRDSWSKLVNSYSGLTQSLNMIFCILYFGGLYLKLSLLSNLSSMQVASAEKADLDPLEFWKKVADGQGRSVEVKSIFEVIVTEHKYWILVTLIIFVFQCFRFYITRKISPLMETERYQGLTPAKTDYVNLIKINRYTSALGLVVLCVFIFDIARMLLSNIYYF